MKTNITMALLTVCGALAFSAGCGKNEGAAPPAAKDTQTPADAAAAQSQKAAEAQRKADAERAAQAAQAAEAQKQMEAAKAADAAKVAEAAKAEATKQPAEAEKLAAEKTAADKLAQTAAAAAQEKGRIQSLIDTAKNLTGQNKYAEALKLLGELANLKLTPEQQALVDGLKQTAQRQAAQGATDKAAAGASKAIGDALGGKK
jgi:hypothetical protein